MRWRRTSEDEMEEGELGSRGREEGEERDGERKPNMGSRVEVERRWRGGRGAVEREKEEG